MIMTEILSRASMAMAFAGTLVMPGLAFAQASPAPPHTHLEKTIGQQQATKAQVLRSLIVMNARRASLQGGKLTLTKPEPR